MALAAQPQMHFPTGDNSHDPSWDGSIVPALRQRLQNESTMLSKRLSTHSITASNTAHAAAASASSASKLPRPSISQDRHQSTLSNASNSTTTTSTSKKRQRTNSTPFAAPALPSTAGDRVSRIPKVSAAKGSTSYHPYRPSALSNSTNTTLNSGSYGSGSLNSRTAAKGRKEYMEPPSPSLDPPSDTGVSVSSRGHRLGTNGKGYIPHEEPPFPNSASTSTEFHYEQTRLMHSPSIQGANSLRGLHSRAMTGDSGVGRMSIDEGNESSDRERPFEHWYRGEAARNGGVGELRVGRAEMMDIAKFGHKNSHSPSKRSSPLSFDITGVVGRRRAGSMDDKRESWVVDDAVAKMSKVIDESPLTDLEGDEYTTEGERSYPYPIAIRGGQNVPNGLGIAVLNNASSGHSRNTSAGEWEEPTFVEEDTIMSTTPTGITPIHSLNGRTLGGSRIPTQSPLGGKRQQTSPASVGSNGKAPLGQNNGATPTKSASSGSVSKPGAQKVKPKPRSRQQSKTASSSQPAQAEQPEEEEEVDGEKIPYRRPPAKGNWDDIVLPAVSKKMGIEGYGLKSETGNILEISEEARKRMSQALQPPVPGLFGYDLSKYRPQRPEEDIHMAELGVSQPSPPGTPKPPTPQPEEIPITSGRDSPLAFSHYQSNLPPLSEKGGNKKPNGVPNIMVSPPSNDGHRKPPEKEEHGGCCGCVIM